MSVQSEIDRINGNISDAYEAVEDKGGTLPETQDSENLADAIATIRECGGPGEVKISVIAEHIPAEVQ